VSGTTQPAEGARRLPGPAHTSLPDYLATQSSTSQQLSVKGRTVKNRREFNQTLSKLNTAFSTALCVRFLNVPFCWLPTVQEVNMIISQRG